MIGTPTLADTARWALAQDHPLQALRIDVVGGSAVGVLAALAAFLVALVLSILVTYHLVQGYRQTRRRQMLYLALGLFLLAAAPMFIRLWFANVAGGPMATRLFTVALAELSGLLLILYVVYDPDT